MTKPSRPQPEFKGMPPQPKSVLRAQEYSLTLAALEDKRVSAEHAKHALIAQLKADKLDRVTYLDATNTKKAFALKVLESLKKVKPGGAVAVPA